MAHLQGGASGQVDLAVEQAMAGTIYHWTLHPWSIYALLALGLALFSYNKGLPLTLRSIFYPLLGERIWGWPGHFIDVLALMATVFGLATSLGFGASQASTGLNYLFDTPTGVSTEVVLICCITMLALVSVVAGLDKGVKVLSELNMLLAVLLLIFVVCVGLQLDVFKSYADNLSAYTKYFIDLSMPFSREDKNFSQGGDSLLLGMVDFMVAFCGYVYCACFKGAYRTRIFNMCYFNSFTCMCSVDDCVWRNRN